MKKISKSVILILLVLSMALLSSCKGKGNDKDKDDDTPKNPGINTEGGVELPIIPYE